MIRTLLSLISIFNFCDWVIAFFIAGTAWRTEGKDGRRTFMAAAVFIFSAGFGVIRMLEFVNFVIFQDSFVSLLKLVPQRYTTQAVILSALKTFTLLFTWFAVSVENRTRRGLASGNVIRARLVRLLEKLR